MEEFLNLREELFKEWCEFIAEIIEGGENNNQHRNYDLLSSALNLLTNLSEEARKLFLQTPGVSIESSSNGNQLTERYSLVLSEYQFIFTDLTLQIFKSRNVSHQISSLYFMTSVLGNTMVEEIKEDLDTFFNLIKSENLLLSSLSARFATLIAAQDKSFVDSLAGDSAIINMLIHRLVVSYQYITEILNSPSTTSSFSTPDNQNNSIETWSPLPHPPLSDENRTHTLFQYTQLPLSLTDIKEWNLSQLEWIACTSLSLLSCVADVLDILGLLLAHNVVQITLDLMKISASLHPCQLILQTDTLEINQEPQQTCRFPSILLAGGHFFEKALAHRKISLEFIERSGLDLFSSLFMVPCASHLEVVLTSCLYTFVSHTQVMEKIIRRKKDELALIYQLSLAYLSSCLTFASRENVIAIFTVILPYRPSYYLFQSYHIIRYLFQMLRVCLFTKSSDQNLTNEGIESTILQYKLNSNFSSFTLPSSSQSLELMYRCVKDIGTERLNELRDDILRVLLIYLRVGALIDLELSSPESLSPMCGGTGNQFSIQSKFHQNEESTGSLLGRRTLSGNSNHSHSHNNNNSNNNNNNDSNHGESMNSTMHPSQYSVITFDGEDSCAGAAESLYHAMREYVSNYNDLLFNPNQSRSLEMFSSSASTSPHSRRDLLWCTPVKLPSTSSSTSATTSSLLLSPSFSLSQTTTRKDPMGHWNRKLDPDITFVSPIKDILKCEYLTLLLYMLQTESTIIHGNSNTIVNLLQALELLCLNPTVIEQMCTTLTLFTTITGHRETPVPDAVNGQQQQQVDDLSDDMESLNGLSIVLDIACRGPKRDSLVKAHALHVLRSLVTPPEYTLLPPYVPLDDVEKYISETRSSRYSVGAATPTSKLDRNTVPVGRVVNVSTPAFDSDLHKFATPHGKSNLHDQTQYPEEERPGSPSSTISSIRYIPISMILERAQKTARGVIRKCNGIHIIAAGLETPITHYIYNIRLAVVQVLLGLAFDTHIRAILTRMDLEHQIASFLASEKYNPHEAWSSPGTKCLKRLVAMIRLCGPRLISLLSGTSNSQQSHSFLFSRPSITASEALTILLKQNDSIVSQQGSLENQIIAANTQITFDQKELLLLVKDYLLEQGLLNTAEMMLKESGILQSKTHLSTPSTPTSSSSSSSSLLLLKSSSDQKNLSNKRNRDEFMSTPFPSSSSSSALKDTPEAGLKLIKSIKIDFSGQKKAVSGTPLVSMNSTNKISKAYYAPSSFDNFSSTTTHHRHHHLRPHPHPHTQQQQLHRPRHTSNSYKTPVKVSSTTTTTPTPSDKKRRDSNLNNRPTNGITLSGIISSFLRHQHQQCQHPVSIVPNFSLFEQHRCPAPPPISNSLCDVLLQRRLFGDNHIRNRSYSFVDINRLDRNRILKHRVYSEYRQWRIFQESQYDHISCAAFSCDSRKVWIGGSSPNADGMERGGSVRLFDISTSQELGQWDFEQSVDNIIPPSCTDTQILMTSSGHGAIVDYLPTVSYRTNIWRTSGQSQYVTDYFLDPIPLIEWEDFCKPVFNSTNTVVCGIPGQQSNFISNIHALLHDVETGSHILSFTQSSTSQSSLISVPYKVPNASFGLGSGGDNIVLADGILWDCRTGGVINDFDRLSHYGHGIFHPDGNCLLIDNVVWDIRKYSLLQTIKMLDGGFKTHFSTDDNGTVLFAYNSKTLEHIVNEEYFMNPLNLPQNCFYTLDSIDYSLIHTFELDSDGTTFWGPIQSDPVGLGYLLTCEVRFDNVRRSMYDILRESCCRVLEIGRKKPGIQDSDMDDAQTIDDEEWEDGLGDERDEDEDDDDEDDDDEEDDDEDEEDSNEFSEIEIDMQGLEGDEDSEDSEEDDDEEDGDGGEEDDSEQEDSEDEDEDDSDYDDQSNDESNDGDQATTPPPSSQ